MDTPAIPVTPATVSTPAEALKLPVWFERIGDMSNAILVKEVRRSIKSRGFVVTFSLLLLISWAISVFGVLAYGFNLDNEAPSRAFFMAYYYCMCAAILVVVPYSAYRSMLNEQEHQTMELLNITTLSPRGIIWGKLQTSIIQIMLYYSIIAPFIAFAFLLPGFDFFRSMYLLTCAIPISIFVTMVSLMASTNVKVRSWQTFSMAGVLIGLIWVYFAVMGSIVAYIFFGNPDFDGEFLLVNLYVLCCGGAVFFLFEQIAISRLTFASDEHALGIRLAILMIYGLCVIGCFMYSVLMTPADAQFFIQLGMIIWSIVGFLNVSQDNFLSRRIRLKLKANNGLFRLIKAPLIQGGSRALVLVLAGLTFNLILGLYFIPWNSNEIVFLLAGTSYAIILLNMENMLSRIISRWTADSKSIHGRIGIIILVVLGVILSFLLMMLFEGEETFYFNHYSPFMLINPFVTLSYALGDYAVVEPYAIAILVTAVGITFFNLANMYKAINAVVFPKLDGPALQAVTDTNDNRGMAVDA
jgi:hypothetical protein